MKNLLKKLNNCLVTLMGTIVSILSVILFSKFQSVRCFRKIRGQRNINDTCYILCNGPSLSHLFEEDHKEMGNVFVVNYFANTEQYKIIKPNNYIVLDNRVVGRDFVSEEQKKMVLNLYNNIADNTTWPMTFFFPNNGVRKYANILLRNKNIKVVVYNMTPVSGIECISRLMFRLSLGMPRPENISNAAVFCALNSGYKKIYLYGVEHSWMRSFDIHPETHKLYMNDGHFYEKDNIRWFKKGDYLTWLGWTQQAMKSHFELRGYADSIGAKIVNKTPTSFIEAYEFEEY